MRLSAIRIGLLLAAVCCIVAGLPLAVRPQLEAAEHGNRGRSSAVMQASASAGQTGEAESIGSRIKQGMSKVSEALVPKKPPIEVAPDAISLAKEVKPAPGLCLAAARLAEQGGKNDKAEAHFRQALQLDPRHLPSLIAYARFKDRQGQLAAATALYQQAATAYPNESSIFNDLGLCFARRKLYQDAVAAFQRAIQLQPDRRLYHNNLATVLAEMGDLNGAFAQLRSVHSEAVSYYNLGYLLQKQGQTKAAARLFAEALQKDPSLIEAQIWLEKLGLESEAAPPAAPAVMAQRPAFSSGALPPPSPSSPAFSRTLPPVRQSPALPQQPPRWPTSPPIAPLPPATSFEAPALGSPATAGAPAELGARVVIPVGPEMTPPPAYQRPPSVQPLPSVQDSSAAPPAGARRTN